MWKFTNLLSSLGFHQQKFREINISFSNTHLLNQCVIWFHEIFFKWEHFFVFSTVLCSLCSFTTNEIPYLPSSEKGFIWRETETQFWSPDLRTADAKPSCSFKDQLSMVFCFNKSLSIVFWNTKDGFEMSQ